MRVFSLQMALILGTLTYFSDDLPSYASVPLMPWKPKCFWKLLRGITGLVRQSGRRRQCPRKFHYKAHDRGLQNKKHTSRLDSLRLFWKFLSKERRDFGPVFDSSLVVWVSAWCSMMPRINIGIQRSLTLMHRLRGERKRERVLCLALFHSRSPLVASPKSIIVDFMWRFNLAINKVDAHAVRSTTAKCRVRWIWRSGREGKLLIKELFVSPKTHSTYYFDRQCKGGESPH